MAYAKIISNLNNELLINGGESEIYFDFEDMAIHNPFVEESGRLPVDPVEYYGKAFLESAFYHPEGL